MVVAEVGESWSLGIEASRQDLWSWRNSGTTETPAQQEGAKEHIPEALLLASDLLLVPCVS